VGRAKHAPKGSTTMTTNASTNPKQTALVASQGAHVAPVKPDATTKTTRLPKSATPKQGANKAATKTAASKRAAKPAVKKTADTMIGQPREGSKKQVVLNLLRRKDGATLADIMKATDWQAHSVRGFISGSVGKKMGLAVESTKTDAGERVYRITGK
jgi:hypothetical protein